MNEVFYQVLLSFLCESITQYIQGLAPAGDLHSNLQYSYANLKFILESLNSCKFNKTEIQGSMSEN